MPASESATTMPDTPSPSEPEPQIPPPTPEPPEPSIPPLPPIPHKFTCKESYLARPIDTNRPPGIEPVKSKNGLGDTHKLDAFAGRSLVCIQTRPRASFSRVTRDGTAYHQWMSWAEKAAESGRLVFCTILMLAVASAETARPADSIEPKLPAEVRALLARRLECHHWAGEDPYDADRARHISRAIARLKCEHIARDEAALRRKHATSSSVLNALEEPCRQTDTDE
jgi:hypothetical protein